MIKEMSKKLTSVIVDEENSAIIDAETILLSIFTVLKDFAPTQEQIKITYHLTDCVNEYEDKYDLILDIENQKVILLDKETKNKTYLNDILFFNYIKEEDYQEKEVLTNDQ